jgi:caffeoyl-CoA O-methyltransferase
MFELSIELEQYITAHIDEEDPLLKDLYRQTHQKILNPRMASGHIQGKILEMLSKMIHPKFILEIGTFTGYSAICLAKGLQAGGVLHTIDINDEIAEFTTSFLHRPEISHNITFHIGDALKIIPELAITFDLVFIDGDKKEYLSYYLSTIDKVKPEGYIIVDNILWDGKVLQNIENNDYSAKGVVEFNEYIKTDTRVEKSILPFRDGIMILRKK